MISSTDRIPRSMRPFDCESATGECSNSVPRDPRRFAILSTHPRLLVPDQISRSPGHNVPIVPSLEHIAESLNQELLPPKDHVSRHHAGGTILRNKKSLLIPFLVGLA